MLIYRNLYIKYLDELVRAVAKWPHWTLAIAGILTVAAGVYSATSFKVNSDRSQMISPDTPFIQQFRAFQDAFPSYAKTIVIVVEADSTQKAVRAARNMHDALVKRNDLFKTVFAPAAEPFFQDNAFLYLDTEDLEDLTAQLAEAQPALSALAEDTNLRGLFGLLETALDAYENGEDLPPIFLDLLEQVGMTGEKMLAGKGENLAWDGTFSPEQEGRALQIITVQGDEDFTSLQTHRKALRAIRDIAEELELTPENGVTVQMTGDIPLSDEEMQAVQDSVSLAGFVSLVLICIILGYGIQSLRIIVALLITLFTGLIWTVAWGLLTVGEYNMISATFAVLFVGLGIDFSIHFALRFQEAIDEGDHFLEAIIRTSDGLGGALSLCALSSAIGFISFVPTKYRAIADLGLISGGGMIIALITSLTVLPALLAVFGKPSKTSTAAHLFTESTRGFFTGVGKHCRPIAMGAATVFVIAALIATQIRFDYNTLALKDQESESFQTLQKLQDEGIATEYAVNIMADSLDDAERIETELMQLETVKDVVTPRDYVPEDEDYKLDLIDETAFLLFPVLNAESSDDPVTDQERFKLTRDLATQINNMSFRAADEELHERAMAVADTLQKILASDNADANLRQFERHLTADIEEPLDFLRTALEAEPIEFDQLPAYVQERVVSPDGRVQLVGLPAERITEYESMKRFVDDVQAAFPEATGRPIVEAGVGDLVVDSFWTAMILALTAIMIVLFITVRRPSDVALIIAPLLLASALSIATSVLFGLSLNQANIIVIPLILGLGVDNGIHVVLRFHEDDSMATLMTSSTPRAVVLSTLTTLGTFGALSLSVHQGIQSMGLLLTISMSYLLVCTVVILPALLYWRANYLKTQTRKL